MKRFFVFSGLIICMGLLLSFTNTSGKGDPWKAPDKYVKMKNPVKADAASIAAGKVLYNKHCASCHGKKGLGDGTKAAQLDTEPGDFTSKAFTSQTDGSLFYKTLEGRDDMPSYKKKIPDEEDIWSVVNYVRSLGN